MTTVSLIIVTKKNSCSTLAKDYVLKDAIKDYKKQYPNCRFAIENDVYTVNENGMRKPTVYTKQGYKKLAVR